MRQAISPRLAMRTFLKAMGGLVTIRGPRLPAAGCQTRLMGPGALPSPLWRLRAVFCAWNYVFHSPRIQGLGFVFSGDGGRRFSLGFVVYCGGSLFPQVHR